MRVVPTNKLIYLSILSLIVVIAVPSFSDPRTILWGHLNGEAVNHYWMFWRSLQNGAVANWPEGIPIPLMDLTNLLFYVPAYWVGGAVFGYNCVVLANILLAFLGVTFWAKRFGSNESAILVGLMIALSPAMQALYQFGITEIMGIGWLGIYFGLAWQGRHTILRRLSLLAFWWCGVYSSIFSVFLGIAFVFLKFEKAKEITTDFAIVTAATIPIWIRMSEAQSLWWARLEHANHVSQRPDWMEQHFFGSDLMAWLNPVIGQFGPSNTIFAGFVLTGLWLWGVRAIHWRWGVAWLVTVLCAAGPWPRIMGNELGVIGPVWVLQTLVDDLRGIQHWHRLAYFWVLLWVPAVMNVINQWKKMRWVLLCVVTVELLSYKLKMSDIVYTEVPNIYNEISDGVLLEFPLDTKSFAKGRSFVRYSNLWQPMHGHPVVMNYEDDIYLLKNNTLSELNRLCFKYSSDKLSFDSNWLSNWDWFLLNKTSCPNLVQTVQELVSNLGKPLSVDDEYLLWKNPNFEVSK